MILLSNLLERLKSGGKTLQFEIHSQAAVAAGSAAAKSASTRGESKRVGGDGSRPLNGPEINQFLQFGDVISFSEYRRTSYRAFGSGGLIEL